MAVNSAKLGNGKLTFGAPGSVKEWAASVKSVTLKPEPGDKEELKVLSGETVVDVAEETWVLEGSVLQSYDTDSLIKWCAENAGSEIPFTFKATAKAGIVAKGKCVIASIAYGGEVDKRNTSEFSFSVVGAPTFGAE